MSLVYVPETLIYARRRHSISLHDLLSFCQDDIDEVMEVVVLLFKDEYTSIANADKTEKNRVGLLDTLIWVLISLHGVEFVN